MADEIAITKLSYGARQQPLPSAANTAETREHRKSINAIHDIGAKALDSVLKANPNGLTSKTEVTAAPLSKPGLQH